MKKSVFERKVVGAADGRAVGDCVGGLVGKGGVGTRGAPPPPSVAVTDGSVVTVVFIGAVDVTWIFS